MAGKTLLRGNLLQSFSITVCQSSIWELKKLGSSVVANHPSLIKNKILNSDHETQIGINVNIHTSSLSDQHTTIQQRIERDDTEIIDLLLDIITIRCSSFLAK